MSGAEGIGAIGLSDYPDVVRTYDIVKRGIDLYNQFEIRGKFAQVSLSAVAYFKKYVKMDEAQSEIEKAFREYKIGNLGTSEYEYKSNKFIIVTDFDYLEAEYDPENIGILEEVDGEEIQIPYVTSVSCFLKPIDTNDIEGTTRNGYWLLNTALKHLSESGIELKSKNIFVTIHTNVKTGTEIVENLEKNTQKKSIPFPPITPTKINFETVEVKIPIIDYSIADILISSLKPKRFGF